MVKRLRAAMLLASMLYLLSALTACGHKTLILAADRVVVPMPAGQAYTPQFDGYFVPKARMQDILDRLSEKEIYGK